MCLMRCRRPWKTLDSTLFANTAVMESDVKVLDPSHVTVYDVLDCKTVLVSQEGLKKLEERLAP